MRRAAFALILLVGCSSPTADNGKATHQAPEQPRPTTIEPAIDTAALEARGGVAYFAGGCFWGVEHFLEQVDGVLRVESGYMGGHLDNPSYEDVSSQTSGHLETVRVYFDPDRVSYQTIARRFFEIHDPTQADGQGPDIGPEYLSAVFVTNKEQRAVVEQLIERLNDRGYAVVTQIRPVVKFWLAEDYHQDWYAKKREQPYCHAPVDRFGDGS
ncbi:MAG TPA: peptide-methionine (S)-S-oxide reductase MsrA [Enhygromyxa sp.]|nr:peptide-methionine (S)-S-oxide reductase MsrA [Enhygromyxa sp.]